MRLETYLAKVGRPRRIEAGQHVFRQGDPEPPCFMMQRGLLKGYYVSVDGKEAIKSFFLPGMLVGSLRSTFENNPAPFSIVALEPTALRQLSLHQLRDRAREDLELANELLEMLIALAIKKEKREHDFLLQSARENYAQLQREVPDLLNRVTQNDIARYLGITPVALSRIRGRMAADRAP